MAALEHLLAAFGAWSLLRALWALRRPRQRGLRKV